METIHNDQFIKFEYDPQTNKYRFPVNAVGAHDYYDIEEADFTPADATCIFVNASTGNDSTGDGTAANPYATTAKGINETDETHVYVIRQDSIVSAEDISGCIFDYFTGLFAASGATPKLSLRVLGTTWTDSNCLHVDSTTGSDDTGDGTESLPYATISHAKDQVTSSKKEIELLNSGTYIEEGFEAPANLAGIHAKTGESPTIQIAPHLAFLNSGKNEKISGDVLLKAITETNFKHVILSDSDRIAFAALSDTGTLKLYIITQAGVDVGETTVKTGMTWYDISVDSDGNIILAYCADNSHTIYWSRYDTDGDIVGSEYSITVSQPRAGADPFYAHTVKIRELVNGNIVICYLTRYPHTYTEWELFYQVVTADNTAVKSQTDVVEDSDYFDDPKILRYEFAYDISPTTAGFAICTLVIDDYKDEMNNFTYSVEAVFIYNTSGIYQSIVEIDRIEGAVAVAHGMHYAFEITGNNYLIVAYRISNGTIHATYNYYRIRVHSGAALVASYDLSSSDTLHALKKTICGGVALNYVRSNVVYFQFFDSTGRTIAETQACSNPATVLSQAGRKNGNLQLLSLYDGNIYSNEWFLSSFDGIKSDHAIEFNGVTISPAEDSNIDTLFDVTGKLTFKWCTVQDVALGRTAYSATAISSTAAIDFLNSVMKDSDIGVDTEEDESVITDSQFIRISEGYAIDIDGEAAASGDITIEHCDIFDCYGGIRLQNNGGTNEIVKNCIIHDIDNYAVNAETEITCDNSVVTGSVNNVNISGSSSYIKANPLYANEGGIDPDDTDLNIKVKILGDVANSPAYGLADDSRNAGAIDVKYVGSITTWSSIRIIKPMVPDTGIVPINPVSSVKRAASYKDGDARIISLKWASEALTADELDDLTAMVCCLQTNGLYAYLVRLYPDPDTFPDSYYLYAIDFAKSSISESAGHYAQTEDGVLGNELVLMRRFEA